MSTTTQQITALIAGCTDLKTYFESIRANLDARAAAAIDDVRGALALTLHVDVASGSDAPEVTGLDPAAPLASLWAAFARAPAGAAVVIALQPGQTVPLDAPAGADRTGAPGNAETIIVRASSVIIHCDDDADRPTVVVGAYTDAGAVDHLGTYLRATASFALAFNRVNLQMPVQPGGVLGDGSKMLVRSDSWITRAQIHVAFSSSIVTLPSSFGVSGGPRCGVVSVSCASCSLVGAGRLLIGADDLTVQASAIDLALSGGAKICDSGTIGQNIITNAPAAAV